MKIKIEATGILLNKKIISRRLETTFFIELEGSKIVIKELLENLKTNINEFDSFDTDLQFYLEYSIYSKKREYNIIAKTKSKYWFFKMSLISSEKELYLPVFLYSQEIFRFSSLDDNDTPFIIIKKSYTFKNDFFNTVINSMSNYLKKELKAKEIKFDLVNNSLILTSLEDKRNVYFLQLL